MTAAGALQAQRPIPSCHLPSLCSVSTTVRLPLQIAMAAFFRIFAYSFPDMESAQVAPGPVISIQVRHIMLLFAD